MRATLWAWKFWPTPGSACAQGRPPSAAPRARRRPIAASDTASLRARREITSRAASTRWRPDWGESSTLTVPLPSITTRCTGALVTICGFARFFVSGGRLQRCQRGGERGVIAARRPPVAQSIRHATTGDFVCWQMVEAAALSFWPQDVYSVRFALQKSEARRRLVRYA